jgi:rod shape-determining protein MreD
MRPSLDRTEVYRFRPWVFFVIPLLGLSLQTYLPTVFPRASALDLSLILTVYFAASRRSQVLGLTLGAALGLAQDAMGSGPIGALGIVKTIIGYMASSLSARLDVDAIGTRLLLIFGFYYVHQALYMALNRLLLERAVSPPGWDSIVVALVNAVTAVLIFQLLDRLRLRE